MGETQTNGKVNGHGAAENPPAAIVPAGQTALEGLLHGESAEQILAAAQQKITLHQGFVKLIAANLSPKTVMLFGDNIWLTKDACLRILGWIGAKITLSPKVEENRYQGTHGPYIEFVAWGTVTLKDGRTIDAMGNCSTLDDFFAKENVYACPTCNMPTTFRNNGGYCTTCNKPVRGEKREYYKPLTEVDIPSIKQKAVTNFFNHALQVLGAMPTKEELIAAGMRLGDGGAVSFGGKKDEKKDTKTSGTTSQKPQQAPPAAQGAAPTGAAAPTEQAKPAAPAPSTNNAVPKARIPKDDLPVGKGIVGEVEEKKTKPKKDPKTGEMKGGGTPFLEVTQNGHTLYCFKNSEIETMEGPEKTFELIKGALRQFCEFIVETKDGNRPMHSIVGAVRIGRHAWSAETGEPISISDGYVADDEDIPF